MRIDRDPAARRRFGELLDGIQPFGTGDLEVVNFKTAPPNQTHPDQGPLAASLRFQVTLTWPASYKGFSAQRTVGHYLGL